MTDVSDRPNWWRRRNWWKIAFFVLLFAFEVYREAAVLDQQPKIATIASMTSFDGYTAAQGRWRRIDGGTDLIPSASNIHCDEAKKECVEVNATLIDGSLGDPDFSRYDATFTPDAIAYENDGALCVTYSVRIDKKLKKVFAVRQRKPNPSKLCEGLESRMELTLGNGFEPGDMKLGKEFVPLVRLLRAVLN